MTDKIRNLLEDVQTVYEGKGMVVHPNSFDKLRMEIIKLDNINKQQSEQIEQMQDAKCISCTDLGGMLLKITDLEKKIAKLESDFRICEKNADTYYDQLTKAKEIIKDLMSFSVQLCDCRHTIDYEKTREQAEQFLNGNGCPDCLCEDCTKDCPIEKIKEIEK